MPKHMDYLQIDLEVKNRSTLDCLQLLDKTVFDEYTFATVTFEHDIYVGNFYDTRILSRKIFEKRGYVRVFSDVIHKANVVFEDWYVHPSLVDMTFIEKIKSDKSMVYTEILSILDSASK